MSGAAGFVPEGERGQDGSYRWASWLPQWAHLAREDAKEGPGRPRGPVLTLGFESGNPGRPRGLNLHERLAQASSGQQSGEWRVWTPLALFAGLPQTWRWGDKETGLETQELP